MDQEDERWSRREFLGEVMLAGSAGLVGLQSARLTAGLLGLHPGVAAAEPLPETTAIKLTQGTALCLAPQFVAGEALLQAEGFTDIQYVKTPLGAIKAVASGQADVSMTFSGPLIIQVDEGDPIVMLGGVHVGCFELFGTDRIGTIRDLKGKTVAVQQLGASQHVFLSAMLTYVGVDPRKDVTWVTHPSAEAIRLLAEGNVDAYMAFPPEPQALRARKIPSIHVVVNSMMDRPWSQYFCCLLGANRDFVRKHPVATKRVLRAILKAADLCVREPGRVAKYLVAKGFTDRYDYVLQMLSEMKTAYTRYREYDPEDTVRFYSLRLHEAGMIKSSPQKIIAQGTDWRFLKELKRELKQ